MKSNLSKALIAATVLLSAALITAEAAAKQPNIVVILTDDQGYADISLNPHHPKEVSTPNMDALAEDGVVFSQGYTSGHVCSPTRAGLMLGRYQQRVGVYSAGDGGRGFDPKLPIFPSFLPDEYVSTALGKWHLGLDEDYPELKWHAMSRGFDECYKFMGRGGHSYFDLRSDTDGKFAGAIYRNKERINDEGYLTDRLSEEAVAFIDRNKEHPFFLYLAYNAVHAPPEAPEGTIEEYRKRFPDISKERVILMAMLKHLDDGVGDVVGKLKKEGLFNNTLLFFLTDIRGDRAVQPPTDFIEEEFSGNWSRIQGRRRLQGGIAPGMKLDDVLPRFTNEAVRVVEDCARSDARATQPLMLYVAYPSPHTPWLPSAEFVGKSGAAMYGDFVMMVDAQIGRILAALQDADMAENTLVVFTSDNGPCWYDRDVERFDHDSAGGLRGMKSDAWEAGHRMPFIVRWPGRVEAGTVSDQTICFTDLLATFAAILGEPLPDEAGPDSFNLLPVLTGEQPENRPIRGPVVMHAGSAPDMMMIRSGDWKLINQLGSGGFSKPKLIQPGPGDPEGQLYNLADDLGETTNLYAQQPKVVSRLKGEMKRIVDTGRSRPPVTNDVLRPYRGPSVSGVDTSTLTGKVMCGYQGWFNCEGDGADLGWTHWARNRNRLFSPGNITVDLWPDMTELGPDERFVTAFHHVDGRKAEVFSSFNRKTVIRHFKWMRDYGIDGAFVQRFAHGLKSETMRHHKDVVLANVREGANRAGRAYAVMYDLSGLPLGGTAWARDDWRMLRDKMHITEDPAYLKHAGRPVVTLWGVGFNDSIKPRKYSLAECRELIEFLKANGCTVMLGVATGWREQKRDAMANPELHEVLQLADIISPWTVGRYRDLQGVARHADEYWKQDVTWCDEHGMDYLPVVFPGFSWHHQKGDALDKIPRLRGQFFWSQIAAAKRAGAEMIYVAMFDEVDEGTAIFKCTNEPPTGDGVPFVTYEGLPSDYYLRLTGQAGRLLRGELQPTDTIPAMKDLR